MRCATYLPNLRQWPPTAAVLPFNHRGQGHPWGMGKVLKEASVCFFKGSQRHAKRTCSSQPEAAWTCHFDERVWREPLPRGKGFGETSQPWKRDTHSACPRLRPCRLVIVPNVVSCYCASPSLGHMILYHFCYGINICYTESAMLCYRRALAICYDIILLEWKCYAMISLDLCLYAMISSCYQQYAMHPFLSFFCAGYMLWRQYATKNMLCYAIMLIGIYASYH